MVCIIKPYVPEMLEIIENCAEMGMTIDEMGQMLGTSGNSIYYYVKNFPEVKAAIKRGEAVANERVVATLYKAAVVGLQTRKTTIRTVKGVRVTDTEIIDHPPDIRAMCKWLHNKSPKEWRDNAVKPFEEQNESGGNHSITINVVDKSDVINQPKQVVESASTDSIIDMIEDAEIVSADE